MRSIIFNPETYFYFFVYFYEALYNMQTFQQMQLKTPRRNYFNNIILDIYFNLNEIIIDDILSLFR